MARYSLLVLKMPLNTNQLTVHSVVLNLVAEFSQSILALLNALPYLATVLWPHSVTLQCSG